MPDKTTPTIKRINAGQNDYLEMRSPDGQLAAIFFNEHFCRRVMEEMFDLSPFAKLPIEEEQNA